MDAFSHISGAAHSGAFGSNGLPQPSLAQVRSGNYRKGRAQLHGMRIAIETPQGTRRTGKANGEPWSVICQAHYGYIEGTKGADGDELDVFVGPWPESQMAYVVNQAKGDDSGFDEHKILLGFPDIDSAVVAYQNSYEQPRPTTMGVVPCSINQLKWWIEFGNHAVPLTGNQLPYDGTAEMNDIAWDSAGNPVGITLPNLIYALRRTDAGDGLLLDAVTPADVLEASDGEAVLDGMVIPLNMLERKLGQMQVIMRAAGDGVKPVALQVTPPFKQRGTTNVAGIFEMSDGQTITVFFHNPDSTPNKLTPTDEMVSWKWMLNKKDVTIVVAREQGKELNPREIARRVMRLVSANSARFQAANSKRAERLANIEATKGVIDGKQKQLDELNAEIERLEPLVAAKRAAPPAKLESADHVVRDGENGVAGTAEDFARTNSPGILEVETAMKMASTGMAWWNDAGANYVINKAAEQGWVARPSTSQVQWTQAGLDALNAAKGVTPAAQELSAYDQWLEGIYTAMESMGFTHSDAQGIVDGQAFKTQQQWGLGATPEAAAKAIMAAATPPAATGGRMSIEDIRKLPGVQSASEWKDRIYVSIRGNGGRFAGEGNSKVWIAADGKLNVQIGKGATSREWDANLSAFKKAYEGRDSDPVPDPVAATASPASIDAIADGVLSAFDAAGWSRSEGSAIAIKSFKSLDITKDALAFLTAGDGYNRTLQFEYTSEGRNIVEPNSVLIPVGCTAEQAKSIAAAGISGAEKRIAESYGARLATADPLDDARAYLGAVIDGSIYLADPAVADRLTELYEAHNGNAEFDELFGKAADAYQAFMVEAAKKAL